MTDSQAPPPPADWYEETENPGVLRWWDGAAWTDHRQAIAASPYAAATSAGAVPAPGQHHTASRSPTDANRAATASLLVGIGSLLFNLFGLPAIAAIVLGVVGIRRSRSTGSGFAASVWGIVLGAISALVTVSLFEGYGIAALRSLFGF